MSSHEKVLNQFRMRDAVLKQTQVTYQALNCELFSLEKFVAKMNSLFVNL